MGRLHHLDQIADRGSFGKHDVHIHPKCLRMEAARVGDPVRPVQGVMGGLRMQDLTPERMGVKRVQLDDLRGGSAAENAQAVKDVLAGKPGPFADLVVVNAGAAILVAGLVDGLLDGIDRARTAISSGKAMAALDAVRRASND